MTKDELKNFAMAALPVLYDLAPIQITPESAVPGMQSEIDELLNLNCPDVLWKRLNYFQVPKSTEHDFEERFYDIGRDKLFLAGIRHLNSSVDRPFIHILLGFTPTLADLTKIEDLARKNFQVFSPKHLGLWLRPSLGCARSLEEKGLATRRYIVGRVQSLIQRPLPSGYERIELERTTDTFDYTWYETAYNEFHTENPELKHWVPRAEKEELQKCADENLLFQVKIDGVLAGLIGGFAEPILGHTAVYITTTLITRPFKRQGLALAIQRKFLDLAPSRYELVWGTIDAKNLPSTKTALKIGRVPIRTEYFLPLG